MKRSLKKLAFAVIGINSLALSGFSQDVPNGGDSSHEEISRNQSENTVPLLLGGIWQNYSRYVVFDTGYLAQDNKSVPQIVLRTFYQWYDDRAAESSEYTNNNPRDSRNLRETNNTTVSSSGAEEMTMTFVPLVPQVFPESYGIPYINEKGDELYAQEIPSGAWDIQIKYSSHKRGEPDVYHVPVAVIGKNLYLNFAVKSISDAGENPLDGYWKDEGSANGILVSAPTQNNELTCYYSSGNKIFKLRYWQTDMDYAPEAKATFLNGDEAVSVPKHIRSGDKTYTCAAGRRTQIRHVDVLDFFETSYELNGILIHRAVSGAEGNTVETVTSAATICVFGKPYLTLTDGSRTMEEIITLDNARRKPGPAPLFPPHGILDFDWSIIEDPPSSYDRRMKDLGK